MDGSLVEANASKDSVLKTDPEMVERLREVYGAQEAKLEGCKSDSGRKALVNSTLINPTDPDAPCVRKKTGGVQAQVQGPPGRRRRPWRGHSHSYLSGRRRGEREDAGTGPPACLQCRGTAPERGRRLPVRDLRQLPRPDRPWDRDAYGSARGQEEEYGRFRRRALRIRRGGGPVPVPGRRIPVSEEFRQDKDERRVRRPQGDLRPMPFASRMHKREARPDGPKAMGAGADRRWPRGKLHQGGEAKPRQAEVADGGQLRPVREPARLQEAEMEAAVAPAYPGSHHMRHRKRKDTDLERAETDDRDRRGAIPQPGIPFAQMGRLETLKAEAMEAMLKTAPYPATINRNASLNLQIYCLGNGPLILNLF